MDIKVSTNSSEGFSLREKRKKLKIKKRHVLEVVPSCSSISIPRSTLWASLGLYRGDLAVVSRCQTGISTGGGCGIESGWEEEGARGVREVVYARGGRASLTWSTCSGFWRLLLLSFSDSALALAAAAAWRFNFSRVALTSPCHRTKNMARCTRANIHPSRIPPRLFTHRFGPLYPPRRDASRRVFRFFSPARTSFLRSPRDTANLIYRLSPPRDRSSQRYQRHFLSETSRASRGLLKKYVYQFPYLPPRDRFVSWKSRSGM